MVELKILEFNLPGHLPVDSSCSILQMYVLLLLYLVQHYNFERAVYSFMPMFTGLHPELELVPDPGQNPRQSPLLITETGGDLPLTHLHVAIQEVIDLDHR